MADTIRRTGHRDEFDAQWKRIASLQLLIMFSTYNDLSIGNGTTTAGNLRTNATADYRIAGVQPAQLASSDDFWDLSGETDTIAGQFRAYWLRVNAAGAASFEAGANAASEAAALAALTVHLDTTAILGVYVAGPSTDFDAAGGLAAQGTIFDGIPAGVPIGVPTQLYALPESLNLVAA